MKRDISVIISLVCLILVVVFQDFWDVSKDYKPNSNLSSWFFIIMLVIAFWRGLILWFQTLIHSIKNEDMVSSIGWAIAHFSTLFFCLLSLLFCGFTNRQKDKKINHRGHEKHEYLKAGYMSRKSPPHELRVLEQSGWFKIRSKSKKSKDIIIRPEKVTSLSYTFLNNYNQAGLARTQDFFNQYDPHRIRSYRQMI